MPIKFRGTWDELGVKGYFQIQSWTEYSGQARVKQGTAGKVQFLFFKGCLVVLKNFSFSEED